MIMVISPCYEFLSHVFFFINKTIPEKCWSMFFNAFQTRWLFAEIAGEENSKSILSVVATAFKQGCKHFPRDNVMVMMM